MIILQFLKTHYAPATVINAGGGRWGRVWFQFQGNTAYYGRWPLRSWTARAGIPENWHERWRGEAWKVVRGEAPRSPCSTDWRRGLLEGEILKLRPTPRRYRRRGAVQAVEQHMPRPRGRTRKAAQPDRVQGERKKYNTELARGTGAGTLSPWGLQ